MRWHSMVTTRGGPMTNHSIQRHSAFWKEYFAKKKATRIDCCGGGKYWGEAEPPSHSWMHAEPSPSKTSLGFPMHNDSISKGVNDRRGNNVEGFGDAEKTESFIHSLNDSKDQVSILTQYAPLIPLPFQQLAP